MTVVVAVPFAPSAKRMLHAVYVVAIVMFAWEIFIPALKSW